MTVQPLPTVIQGAGDWGDYVGPGMSNLSDPARIAVMVNAGNSSLAMSQIPSVWDAAQERAKYARFNSDPLAGINPASVANMSQSEIAARYGSNVADAVSDYYRINPSSQFQKTTAAYDLRQSQSIGRGGLLTQTPESHANFILQSGYVTEEGAKYTGRAATYAANNPALVAQKADLGETKTIYAPLGNYTQIEMQNSKILADRDTGELGIYQPMYFMGKFLGFGLTGGGSRNALQSGTFTQNAPETPYVVGQSDVGKWTSMPVSVTAGLSRLGAEAYGGFVKGLDGRVIGTGVSLSVYSNPDNLANLANPQGPNMSRLQAPGVKIPWSIEASSPAVQMMNQNGIINTVAVPGQELKAVLSTALTPTVSPSAEYAYRSDPLAVLLEGGVWAGDQLTSLLTFGAWRPGAELLASKGQSSNKEYDSFDKSMSDLAAKQPEYNTLGAQIKVEQSSLNDMLVGKIDSSGHFTGTPSEYSAYQNLLGKTNADVAKYNAFGDAQKGVIQSGLSSGAIISTGDGGYMRNPDTLHEYGAFSDWQASIAKTLRGGASESQIVTFEQSQEFKTAGPLTWYGEGLWKGVTNPVSLAGTALQGVAIYAGMNIAGAAFEAMAPATVVAEASGISTMLPAVTLTESIGSLGLRTLASPLFQYGTLAAFTGFGAGEATGWGSLPASQAASNLGGFTISMAAMGAGAMVPGSFAVGYEVGTPSLNPISILNRANPIGIRTTEATGVDAATTIVYAKIPFSALESGGYPLVSIVRASPLDMVLKNPGAEMTGDVFTNVAGRVSSQQGVTSWIDMIRTGGDNTFIHATPDTLAISKLIKSGSLTVSPSDEGGMFFSGEPNVVYENFLSGNLAGVKEAGQTGSGGIIRLTAQPQITPDYLAKVGELQEIPVANLSRAGLGKITERLDPGLYPGLPSYGGVEIPGRINLTEMVVPTGSKLYVTKVSWELTPSGEQIPAIDVSFNRPGIIDMARNMASAILPSKGTQIVYGRTGLVDAVSGRTIKLGGLDTRPTDVPWNRADAILYNDVVRGSLSEGERNLYDSIAPAIRAAYTIKYNPVVREAYGEVASDFASRETMKGIITEASKYKDMVAGGSRANRVWTGEGGILSTGSDVDFWLHQADLPNFFKGSIDAVSKEYPRAATTRGTSLQVDKNRMFISTVEGKEFMGAHTLEHFSDIAGDAHINVRTIAGGEIGIPAPKSALAMKIAGFFSGIEYTPGKWEIPPHPTSPHEYVDIRTGKTRQVGYSPEELVLQKFNEKQYFYHATEMLENQLIGELKSTGRAEVESRHGLFGTAGGLYVGEPDVIFTEYLGANQPAVIRLFEKPIEYNPNTRSGGNEAIEFEGSVARDSFYYTPGLYFDRYFNDLGIHELKVPQGSILKLVRESELIIPERTFRDPEGILPDDIIGARRVAVFDVEIERTPSIELKNTIDRTRANLANTYAKIFQGGLEPGEALGDAAKTPASAKIIVNPERGPKDAPEIYALSRSIAADIYTQPPTVDFAGVRTQRMVSGAEKLETLSDNMRLYIEGLKSDPVANEKVLSRYASIKSDLLKGVDRNPQPSIDLITGRGWLDKPAAGWNEEAVFMPGRRYAGRNEPVEFGNYVEKPINIKSESGSDDYTFAFPVGVANYIATPISPITYYTPGKLVPANYARSTPAVNYPRNVSIVDYPEAIKIFDYPQKTTPYSEKTATKYTPSSIDYPQDYSPNYPPTTPQYTPRYPPGYPPNYPPNYPPGYPPNYPPPDTPPPDTPYKPPHITMIDIPGITTDFRKKKRKPQPSIIFREILPIITPIEEVGGFKSGKSFFRTTVDQKILEVKPQRRDWLHYVDVDVDIRDLEQKNQVTADRTSDLAGMNFYRTATKQEKAKTGKPILKYTPTQQEVSMAKVVGIGTSKPKRSRKNPWF